MHISYTEESTKQVTCDEAEIKPRIGMLCTKFKLRCSSTARLSIVDDELIITTSYGCLVVQEDLLGGERHQGNPKGHLAGHNETGHKLTPSSDSGY